jgi:hypothetical protein
MLEYEEAKRLIGTHDGADFIGPRPEEWIAAAEARLGLTFPPTYRRFLQEFGCGAFRSEDFYGIVRNSFDTGTAPNGVWVTLHERETARLPPGMVIVQSGGDGTWHAIDTTRRSSPSGEAPVMLLDVTCRPLEVVADDFGSFFLDRVQQVL